MDWQRVLPAWARRAAVRAGALPPAPVPAALWQATVATYPFLERLTPAEDAHLQQLVAHFLQRKEFSGAHGLVITDAMAVAIAAQACVLLLYFGEPADALRWYDDFVGIVVHCGRCGGPPQGGGRSRGGTPLPGRADGRSHGRRPRHAQLGRRAARPRRPWRPHQCGDP